MSSVKLYFRHPSGQQDIRRWTNTSPQALPALLAYLADTYAPLYPNARFLLRYNDGEDECLISSESELQEALCVSAGAALAAGTPPLLKLNVSVDTLPAHAASSASGAAVADADGGDSDQEYVRLSDAEEDGVVVHGPPAPEEVPLASPPLCHSDSAVSAVMDAAVATVVQVTENAAPLLPTSVEEATESPLEIADVTGHQLVHAAAEPSAAAEVERGSSTSSADPVASAPASSAAPPPRASRCPYVAALASAAAGSPSASTAHTPVTHLGFTCDGCGQSPIVGPRFHCTTCTCAGGFDLCASCEAAGDKHPSTHLMLKHRVPVCPHAGSRFSRPQPSASSASSASGATQRPRATFVSDVSVADGLRVRAGQRLVKTWRIKNAGDSAWPEGTRLVFASGDLCPSESDNVLSGGRAALVPATAAGDVVNLSLELVVPDAVGRFRSTFRLETADGYRFGPRLWIDVTVPGAEDAEEKQDAPEDVSDEEEEDENEEDEDDDEDEDEDEEDEVDEEDEDEEDEDSDDEKDDEVAVAEEPQPQPQQSAPAAAGSAEDDDLRRALDESLRMSQSPASSVQSGQSSPASAQRPAEAPAQWSSPVVESPQSRSQAQFTNQLASLRSMGFNDTQLNLYLLSENKGDVQRVVSWLLQHCAAAK